MSKGRHWTTSAILAGLIAAITLWSGAADGEDAAGEDAMKESGPAYKLDTAHTGVVFHINHMGMSQTWGRFNEVAGEFNFDSASPAASQFKIAVKTASVDTNNTKRDDHLRSPDFFNAAQFPLLTFRSTSVAPGEAENTYTVTGDVQLHGVTRSVTLTLTKLGEGEDNRGNQRVGFASQFTVKRSDFGMDHMVGPVGDEVAVFVSFEGVR